MLEGAKDNEDGGAILTRDEEVHYEPPAWGGRPQPTKKSKGKKKRSKELPIQISLESPLDGGHTIETFDLMEKGHYTIGRLSLCDVHIDHLSISKTHAILQFARGQNGADSGDTDKKERKLKKENSWTALRRALRRGKSESDALRAQHASSSLNDDALERDASPVSFFVHDLDSERGTYVNDHRLPPLEFYPVHAGDVLRFGDCPRAFTVVRRQLALAGKTHRQPAGEVELEDDNAGESEEQDYVDDEDEEQDGEEEHQDEDVDGETPHLLCVDVGTTGLRAYAYDVSGSRRDGNTSQPSSSSSSSSSTSTLSSSSSASSGSSQSQSRSRSRSRSGSRAASCRNRGGCYQSLPTLYPQPGWVEQDPHVVLDTFTSVVKQVLQKTRIQASQVKAIGITTQRGSFLLWNKDTGEPLCNFITWQDVRTASLCEEWNESYAFRGIHAFSKFAHMMTRRSRHLMGSIFKFAPIHCTPRLMWAMRNVPGAQELAAQGRLLFGTTDTWLLWNLTGGKVHATDYSNASATGLYDTFELGWNQQLFSVVGLPASIFPEVRPTSGDFGSTKPELFGAAIPIRAVVADQQAALFGECCFDVGDSKVTIGTGCFIDINTGNQPLVSPRGLLPLIAWAIGKEGEVTYMIEGPMPSMGSVIDWGAREMGWYDEARETEAMASSVPDTHGAYFVPAFSGLAAPHQDPTARGTILGMTTSTKKQHLVRAMLESIGYTCNDLLETVKADLPNLRVSPVLKIDGGVSQNNFVNQFIADMTGREIIRHARPDLMTVLGAAFLAGLGAGVWKSKGELKAIRSSMDRYVPQLDDETRAAKYAAWKRAVERAMRWAQEKDGDLALQPPPSPGQRRPAA